MEQNTMLIPQVNIRTRNWTSRITITEDIPALTSGTGLGIKRYNLTDNEGNQIATTIFGSHIHILAPKLQLFTVQDITNVQVRFVEPQYVERSEEIFLLFIHCHDFHRLVFVGCSASLETSEVLNQAVDSGFGCF
ncbi:hypothetical protein LIER_31220 [Lithospermum erythrorhizon]|uniref:Uncharacterized protein n=1 Tax=Lithospermum erythrorhizon TaxID=34254 RepID=A0AAV3RQC9_LITER